MSSERINCSKCIYYYITWDSYFPRGCKLYGFKTKNMPSILVKQSSGISCGKFTLK